MSLAIYEESRIIFASQGFTIYSAVFSAQKYKIFWVMQIFSIQLQISERIEISPLPPPPQLLNLERNCMFNFGRKLYFYTFSSICASISLSMHIRKPEDFFIRVYATYAYMTIQILYAIYLSYFIKYVIFIHSQKSNKILILHKLLHWLY